MRKTSGLRGFEYLIREIECLNGLQHMMRNLDKRLYEGISAEERQEMKETLLKMRENVLRYKEFQGMDMCEIMEKTRPPKCRKNRFNRKEKFHLL